jgi:hypothetical protein
MLLVLLHRCRRGITVQTVDGGVVRTRIRSRWGFLSGIFPSAVIAYGLDTALSRLADASSLSWCGSTGSLLLERQNAIISPSSCSLTVVHSMRRESIAPSDYFDVELLVAVAHGV